MSQKSEINANITTKSWNALIQQRLRKETDINVQTCKSVSKILLISSQIWNQDNGKSSFNSYRMFLEN